MGFSDIFKIEKFKVEIQQLKSDEVRLNSIVSKLQEERDYLQKQLNEVERMEALGLSQLITSMQEQKKSLQEEVNALSSTISHKRKENALLDEEIFLQDYGFYQPKYNMANSAMYKERLEQVRAQQAQMIKAQTAATASGNWSVNNSVSEGRKLVADYIKILLRSFNTDCDNNIANVKFSNFDSIDKKIRRDFDSLNRLARHMGIRISEKYLSWKIEELHLAYEYQIKKQEEKEEQKRLREQMREEIKLNKEIEEAKLSLTKEQKHFTKALTTLAAQLLNVATYEERELLLTEKAKIEEKLAKVNEGLTNVENREQNTRAGFVYIISNVGAFGEDIYKIGVTRRLDPQERIDELGDASVPFNFDVHALIFSEDAPALERALHTAFEARRLNMINTRREFFNVTLDEIETVVVKRFSKPVEFIRVADASEYRASLTLKSRLSSVET